MHIRILDEVCANILENAKEVFQTKVELAKKQNRGKSPGQVLKRSSSSASNSPVSKKSCVIKSGKKHQHDNSFDCIICQALDAPTQISFLSTRQEDQ